MLLLLLLLSLLQGESDQILIQYLKGTLYRTKRIHFYAPNFEKVGDILVSACLCVWGGGGGMEISS